MSPLFSVNNNIETDEEIDLRIQERFTILELVALSVITGSIRSLIVSGPAGVGKSYCIDEILNNYDPEKKNHAYIKGRARATGLFKLFYQYRNDNQIIVFDDCDEIFRDEISLNLLKAVCDSTDRRRVSWLSEGKLVDENSGQIIPSSFDFNGKIIFLTNIDFDKEIDRDGKLAPHLQAILSRSHFIDLGMKSKRDIIIRIKQVIKDGMLFDMDDNEKNDVINFIEKNSDILRELSLRSAIKCAQLRKEQPDMWEDIAKVTLGKNTK